MNAAAAPAAAAEGKADAGAWLAVAAGTIGSFMATLDISIVNAALPTIQGEVGASGTEGTWISTAFLVSEIVMIPLTGWFVRTLGLRTFLLICATLFTAFSVMCGLADSLPMMIAGRVGQGFAGGALIPTALTIVGTRLPPKQQPLGTALFGMTVILGPVIGPLLGGWLTENVSWHYAFFINVPICAGLVALLLLGLPHERSDWGGLLRADWLGILGMTAYLSALTVVLEDGQRERWFESTLIVVLTVVSVVGFALLALSQFTSKTPVIRLNILFQRSFGAVFVMVMAVGMILFGVMYMIPQFLAIIAGYNTEQAGLRAAAGLLSNHPADAVDAKDAGNGGRTHHGVRRHAVLCSGLLRQPRSHAGQCRPAFHRRPAAAGLRVGAGNDGAEPGGHHVGTARVHQ